MYGVREVAKLLRMPRSTIDSLVRTGFVSPSRGPRNALRFSFQDLIVLRTAQALAAANVPARRITKSLKDLRRHLPEAMPLSGLSIEAVGERVVVKERSGRWRADSGQYLLAFEGDPGDGSLRVIQPAPAKASAADLQDDATLDARLNLGLRLHEAGRLAEAERVYRDALAAWGDDPVLLYNLGVLLDDLDRKGEALSAYQNALRGDPAFADCHYNLALLCEQMDKPRDAIRHMAAYRKLSRR